MAGDKIEKKYYAAVWVALIVACFVRNAYGIYVYCAGITEISALRIVTALISIVFFEGAVPALVTFLFAWIVWRVGIMRYVRCISRKDFCCLVMGFTAASRFLVGIIDIFSVLETNVQIAASITAMCVYFVYLAVVIILGERLNKQAKLFRDPETRGDYYEKNYDRGYNMRSDADAVFGGYDSEKQEQDSKDNVFDEFDI